MHPPTPALLLEEGQRDVLEVLARSTAVPHREVVRAQALLLATEGLANTAIAAQVGVAPSSVVTVLLATGWQSSPRSARAEAESLRYPRKRSTRS